MGKLSIYLLSLASLFFCSCAYKLSSYEEYVVGSPACKAPRTKGEVSVTYLGTSGYLIESGKTAIAVDPFFSRHDLRTVLLNGPIPPKPDVIASSVKKAAFPDSIDGWLVTHAHFDHALDIPCLQRQFGGKTYSSETGRALFKACGVPARTVKATTAGKCFRIGDAKVSVLEATHDRLVGMVVPYPGELEGDIPAPTRPKDWKVGEPLAYLIEIGGKKIYIESGGMGNSMPSEKAKGVDLAIMGVAVADSQYRYPKAVQFLCPKYVMPTHQDNFFEPLESGFQFASTANFPKILAHHQACEVPGKLALMEFFHEWVLP
ncbi:MAG: MBL fold metallo-hydrolase [Verrucomicrobiales bacterium]|nr:MBL fold metallo-hydrolase [Verrucomicrobiales bacterium]